MKIFRGLLSLILGTRILGEDPKAGDVYLLDSLDKKNPFNQDEQPQVTVLEVKKGWVKYQIGHGNLSPDSTSIRTFLIIHTKKK